MGYALRARSEAEKWRVSGAGRVEQRRRIRDPHSRGRRQDTIKRGRCYPGNVPAAPHVVTTLRGAPAQNASMLSISWSARLWIASSLAQAVCGVRMKFGSLSSRIRG
jgi:hypothetical protein